MRRNNILRGLAGALLLAMLLVAPFALAQSGSSLTLGWWTVDGGGGELSGGGYTLRGTVGQPDVGTLRAGGLTLRGGFWVGEPETSVVARPSIYMPIIVTGG